MVNNRRTKKGVARMELLKDVLFIFIGGLVTYFLSQAGIIDSVINFFGGNIVAIFVSGLFFTSVFTIAPASVVLVSMANVESIHTVAIFGALGALCGDMILFYFIRDKFTDDLMNSLKPSFARHFFKSLHLGFMKWLSPILGAFIIASPLPDEIGLTLMGLSKVRMTILVPVAFVMNVLGIYAIVWFGSML